MKNKTKKVKYKIRRKIRRKTRRKKRGGMDPPPPKRARRAPLANYESLRQQNAPEGKKLPSEENNKIEDDVLVNYENILLDSNLPEKYKNKYSFLSPTIFNEIKKIIEINNFLKNNRVGLTRDIFEFHFGDGSDVDYYQRYFSRGQRSMDTHKKLEKISKNIQIAHLRFLEYYNYYKRDGKLHEILSVIINKLHKTATKEKPLNVLDIITSFDRIGFRFNLPGLGLTSISPLSYLTNLQYLNIQSNNITNFNPIGGMSDLEYLDIMFNLVHYTEQHFRSRPIADYSPLSNLTNLKTLLMTNAVVSVSDYSWISTLTNLKYLWLQNVGIQDVSPLSTLINLRELWLSDNQIQDVSPLSNLINLQELRLDGNPIQDVSPLSTLINLKKLDLGGEKRGFKDPSPLTTLINLQELRLRGRGIKRKNRHILDVLKPKCKIIW